MSTVAAPLNLRLRLELRRYPWIHKPLQWLNKTARPVLGRSARAAVRSVLPSKSFGFPRGWFSDYEWLRQGKLEGKVILTDQGSPRLPNPSVTLLCGRKQHLEQPWPIFWTRHRNVRLVGASLAHLNENKEVSLDAVYGRKRLEDDPAYAYWIADAPLRLEGAWTSIVSRWVPIVGRPNYSHWLLDALPRLAALDQFPPNTRILIPPHQLRYQVESLKLLGLWERCRQTTEKHLLIEDYYFSSPTSMIVCHDPYGVAFLRSKFLPLAKNGPSFPKRFFVRRTSYGRNMVNEQEVLDFFAKAGWAIIDTAAVSFLEQIQLFVGAEAIFAIHGSGTANMVWCSPGCKVVEMFPDSYMAGDQEWIAQCMNADYHFMIFPSDHKMDALIDLDQVKEKLRELKLL